MFRLVRCNCAIKKSVDCGFRFVSYSCAIKKSVDCGFRFVSNSFATKSVDCGFLLVSHSSSIKRVWMPVSLSKLQLCHKKECGLRVSLRVWIAGFA